MACDSCGAKRGHLGGCPVAGGPGGGGKKRKSPTPGDKTHKHDYKTTHTRTGQDENDLILYEFQRCGKPGCPQPDYVNIIRTPKRKKK